MNIHEALGRKIVTGRDTIPWGYGVGPCPYDSREIWIYPLPYNHLVYWAERFWRWFMVSRQHEMITVKEADRRVEEVLKQRAAIVEEAGRSAYIEGFKHGWRSCDGGYAFVRPYAPLMTRRHPLPRSRWQ